MIVLATLIKVATVTSYQCPSGGARACRGASIFRGGWGGFVFLYSVYQFSSRDVYGRDLQDEGPTFCSSSGYTSRELKAGHCVFVR